MFRNMVFNDLQARSRYEEDVHPGNHTSVWGSYWRDGEWGYACCHQFVKNSYCTGHAGEQAAEHNLAMQQRNLEAKAAAMPPSTDASAPHVSTSTAKVLEAMVSALEMMCHLVPEYCFCAASTAESCCAILSSRSLFLSCVSEDLRF